MCVCVRVCRACPEQALSLFTPAPKIAPSALPCPVRFTGPPPESQVLQPLGVRGAPSGRSSRPPAPRAAGPRLQAPGSPQLPAPRPGPLSRCSTPAPRPPPGRPHSPAPSGPPGPRSLRLRQVWAPGGRVRLPCPLRRATECRRAGGRAGSAGHGRVRPPRLPRPARPAPGLGKPRGRRPLPARRGALRPPPAFGRAAPCRWAPRRQPAPAPLEALQPAGTAQPRGAGAASRASRGPSLPGVGACSRSPGTPRRRLSHPSPELGPRAAPGRGEPLAKSEELA